MKIAIFVEGQTELIFVREMLLKVFEYQNIAVECYTLHTDSERIPTEYAFPNENALFYFEILEVGNDKKVLSAILKREKYLWSSSQGFDRIVGLRDMYSKDYRDAVGNHQISEEINRKFIEGAIKTIKEKAERPDKIFFHFAIMEIEAWLLGLQGWLPKLDTCLTDNFIEQNLGFRLSEIKPETAFFHPVAQFEKIYELVGKKYDKKKGDVNAIMGYLEKNDFYILYESEYCTSFNAFFQSLGIYDIT